MGRKHKAEARSAGDATTESRGNALLEKALVNLRVTGQLQEGDRLAFTTDGFFLLQRPSSRLATLLNSLSRAVSRQGAAG